MKRVVILGAGFGGLRAARKIDRGIKHLGLKDRYSVVLIDRNDHQVYTPLLYEAATTSKETANLADLHNIVTYDIRSLLRGSSIEFLQTEVGSLDLPNGRVLRDGGQETKADYLVVALGSEPNYFDIPGLRERALPFKTMKDAIAIRDAVWNRVMEGDRSIRIVIGGAGPSGVELAGEMKVWCGELDQEFKNCNLDITLVEASQTVMPGFDARVVRTAQKRLAKLGVHLLEGQKIMSVAEHAVNLDKRGELPFDILIWTGGVKAPDVLARSPLKTESRGRIEVAHRMECLPQTPDLKLHGKIYGLGDSICFYDSKTGAPVPGVARAALIQADVVAQNILHHIALEEQLKHVPKRHTYEPTSYPYVTPIGGKYAIAKIGPLVFSGFPAWFFKGIVELNYLLSIMPPLKAIRTWLMGLKVFIQNDRLG